MNCLDLQTTDPAFNLAVEELLLKGSSDEFFIVYKNSPSVVIGRNQIANMEADTGFCHKNRIPIIRRITGGGTVFHDHGNLNFTFISNGAAKRQDNFKLQTGVILQFLSNMGVEASIEGKNDIKTNGMKISGNAETVYRDRVMRHGTLLVEADMELLNRSIRKDITNYSARSVASKPSPTQNIKELVRGEVTTDKVKKDLYKHLLSLPGNCAYTLPKELAKGAESLSKTKYNTWEWNFGAGPNYSFDKCLVSNSGQTKCHLEIISGKIVACSIEDPNNQSIDVSLLIGLKHFYPDILNKLEENPPKNITVDLLF